MATQGFDVVVVGAGLAGLACARELCTAGRDVLLLEADERPGGRVRTDLLDGYRLDRGFQVLLTGYPALARYPELAGLDVQAFAPGVIVHDRQRRRRLADPRRAPLQALAGLGSGVVTVGDVPRLLAWSAHLLRGDGSHLARDDATSTARLLARRGFSSRLRDGVFRPFLAATFLDGELATSSRLTELVFRSLLRGDVGVPAKGMQALPDLLATGLPAGTLRTSTRVTSVAPGGVLTADGEHLTAQQVVVATSASVAAQLLSGGSAPGFLPSRGSTTWYLRAPSEPGTGRDLVLGDGRSGPVRTLATMSAVAPSYAPGGGDALVSVMHHGIDTGAAMQAAVQGQLRVWFGASVDDWEVLAVYPIPEALPRQEASDLVSLARTVAVAEGLWVCGDHRDTASIQGALVSGRRTAEAILAA